MHKFFSVQFNDASEQETALPGWEQRFVQLVPMQYSGQVDYLVMPGIRITRERVNATLAQTTCTPPDGITFVFIINQDARWRINSTYQEGSVALVTVGAQEFVSVNDGGYDMLIVTIARDRFPIDCETTSGTRYFSGPAKQHCLDWLLGLLEQSRHSTAMSELDALLPEIVIEQLSNLYLRDIAFIDGGSGDGMDIRVFRQISAILRDGEASDYTMDALVTASGLTRETIHQAVRSTLALDASAWLRRLRLEGARRDLLASHRTGKSVAEVAFHWRFWHLSRFANTYRVQFGETPSQTARTMLASPTARACT